MSVQWSADAGPRVSDDEIAGWVRRIVADAVTRDDATLVRYAAVRTLWVGRVLATLQARTVLTALGRAAAGQPGPDPVR